MKVLGDLHLLRLAEVFDLIVDLILGLYFFEVLRLEGELLSKREGGCGGDWGRWHDLAGANWGRRDGLGAWGAWRGLDGRHAHRRRWWHPERRGRDAHGRRWHTQGRRRYSACKLDALATKLQLFLN